MQFILTIRMNNAAFDDAAGLELARILAQVAEQVDSVPVSDGSPEALRDETRGHTRSVFDINGNRVGGWKIEGQ